MVPPPHPGKSSYRADIDGLRALAILAVVFFHYRIAGFGGGFAGVDIFFVISGFLITRLIHGEMLAGRFSIARFYERRVRRIFPALVVMLVGASVAAAVILFASDFVRYARTLLATAVFATNFELWRESGYFDLAARQKPLLHLWSIAVEEQFYLLFPLVLLAMRRRSHAVKLGTIAALAVASFLYALWGVRHTPTAAFYLLPGRMWELMLGGLLAVSDIAPVARWQREGAGCLGLALIAWCVFAFDDGAKFPGAAALVPCLGAALVIFAGNGAAPGEGKPLAGRLLSLKPVVFVGLISYSLYLWHWPLNVFARYLQYRTQLGLPERLGLIALSVVLAALSWHFVEQPLRRASWRPAGRRLAAMAAASLVCVAAAAGSVLAMRGMPWREPPPIRRMLAEEHDTDGLLQYCFALPLEKLNAKGLCRFGAGHAVKPSFILWGDSHADAILLAVEDGAKQVGREGFFAGESSCAPLMGVYRFDTPRCRAFNNKIMAFVKAHPEIKTVILMARWGKNADGTAYGVEGHGFVPIADKIARARKPSDDAAIFTRGLVRTVNALRAAHRQVVLVGPVPVVGLPVPQTLARLALAGDSHPIGPTVKRYRKRERIVLPLFHKLAKRKGVRALYPAKVMCASGRCLASKNGIPLYRDGHHLSVYGARQLDPLLARIFTPGERVDVASDQAG